MERHGSKQARKERLDPFSKRTVGVVAGFDSKQIDEKAVVGMKETLRDLILCKQEMG